MRWQVRESSRRSTASAMAAWAGWGVDYLKYDNCNNQSDGSQQDFIRRYTAMRRAPDHTGRPIVYSITEWGQSRPWEWATGVGHLWRTTGDIGDNWPSLRSIIAFNAPLYPFAGPGHWNDPDMMEIGNGGMTDIEYRTHMSMWAMMAAPLLIGTDLRTASPQTLAILGNREIIAVDQDPLGRQGTIVSDADGLMVLDKPLANGDRAIALYNATDALATVSVPAGRTGLRPARGYQLRDLWTGSVTQAKTTISAAVPAHGTVVYRVRPVRDPAAVAPSVPVGAGLGTLVPGPAGGTLTTTVTNRGAGEIDGVRVRVQVPEGWTVSASGPTKRRDLATDATLRTTWTVTVPEGTAAGRYPITVTAGYTWGRRHRTGTSTSEVISTVVTAPADGRRHLGSVLAVGSTNARGPVEIDQSNGDSAESDGALLTIGGRLYTRGIGTTAPSEISYYLGGRCTGLTADVGVDDEAATTIPATFTVFADDTAVAASGPVLAGTAPRTLTADLTGATWLRLVTTGSGPGPDGTTVNDHTDWAAPILTCGIPDPADPVLPVERTVFSFETGTEEFTIVNPGDGGTVAHSTAFHTEGDHGLEVFPPTPGNWFGRRYDPPLDLTGTSTLKFDLRSGPTVGTTAEIAVQVGPNFTWCQGSRWTWTNPNSTRTIAQKFTDLGCPAGSTVDPGQLRAVWLFLNGAQAFIDNVRAE
ncbi:MAG TPA: NPCBM/NEW2 domain-containing protein [Actinophytocola sp.]|uniref:NPCBM/NEW2 domain-containing protein n=1 Tax=Actinophytocola sp. TaxID=1872138 RepID=UPI002DBF3F6B|nr:NPCBM/NEW2 domain-containing protein [Actinophytocola sp.]HEU5470927.1 NPCBM/NEW2 domain-containing protein [Actinophytocola sp.]